MGTLTVLLSPLRGDTEECFWFMFGRVVFQVA